MILGIRTAPKEVRYALIEGTRGAANFTNAAGENRLKFPAGLTETEQKLSWLHGELERIFYQNPSISKVMLKTSEYNRRGGESSASRQAAYLDAIVMNIAGLRGIPIECKLYAGLDVRRDTVKTATEQHTTRSQTHWNEQMADAVIAAWSGLEN